MALPVNCSARRDKHRSFARPFTALAVIEGLGTRLVLSSVLLAGLVPSIE